MDRLTAGERVAQEARGLGDASSELVIGVVIKLCAGNSGVDEYIAVFYVWQRSHSQLGNLSRAAFAQSFYWGMPLSIMRNFPLISC